MPEIGKLWKFEDGIIKANASISSLIVKAWGGAWKLLVHCNQVAGIGGTHLTNQSHWSLPSFNPFSCLDNLI